MAVNWGRAPDEPQPAFFADRHLYLTSDFQTVVEEGDERSASQFVAKGHPISQADADRLALVLEDGRVVQRRAGEPQQESSEPSEGSDAKKPAAKKSAAKKRGT